VDVCTVHVGTEAWRVMHSRTLVLRMLREAVEGH
jgi:hypothetical protein